MLKLVTLGVKNFSPFPAECLIKETVEWGFCLVEFCEQNKAKNKK